MVDLTEAESRERMGGEGAVLGDEIEKAEAAGGAGRSVILVEGASDRRALQALARRQGLDLEVEGISIIATTGATNFDRFVAMLGPDGHDVALNALCDEGEVAEVRSALAAGPGGDNCVYTCVRDLEDELIRALRPGAMLTLMEEQGDLRRFHSFQNQPDQRLKTIDRQIWRWLGNHKIRYAPLMVEALDLELVPAPLQDTLHHHLLG